jgi:hypothetical protein
MPLMDDSPFGVAKPLFRPLCQSASPERYRSVESADREDGDGMRNWIGPVAENFVTWPIPFFIERTRHESPK